MSEATELRDEALDRVQTASSSWFDRALSRFETIELPEEFTGEDIRLGLTEGGLEPPHHPNVWGSITMHLVRSGKIIATGGFTQMKDPKSHARITRLYRRPDSKPCTQPNEHN